LVLDPSWEAHMFRIAASSFVAAAAFGLVVLSAPSSHAQTCETDADCSDGFACRVTGGSVGCAVPDCPPGETCPEPEPCEVVEYRECVPSCETDADCTKGFVCEVTSSTGCAVPACPAGETCPEPEPCEPEEYRECVPGPCESDADCGQGLMCLVVTGESCVETDYGCPEGTECPPPETECEPYTQSACVPEWIGPCQADADCGEGLACRHAEECTCSAGGSGGGSGADDPVEPTCDCQQSEDGYCEPQEIPCEATSDCPADWTCEQVGSDDVSCSVPDDGSEPDCEPASEPTLLCAPPYWEVFGGTAGGLGADEASTESRDADSAAEQAPSAVDDSGDATGADAEDGDDASSAGADDDGDDASGDGADGDSDGSASESSGSDGGCQVSLERSPTSGVLLLALGLIGLARRRRRGW